MSDRILLGKGTSARGSSNYGLWISKSGQSVLTDGDDDLIFNSNLVDATAGVTSKNGETFGVKYKGYVNASTASNGASGWFLIKAWLESDFTFDSTLYVPLVLAQVGETTGAATTQFGYGGFYFSNGTGYGMLFNTYPKNRTSSGSYSASGTYGAALGSLVGLGASTTFRVYYAICFPYIQG